MKRKNLLINLGLVFSMLFCLAFACNDGDEKGGGTDTGNPPPSSASSETGPPTEQEVKDSFLKRYENSNITFESIQIKPTVSAHTSNLGVYVHGYPVKVDFTLWGEGFGYKNGERETGGNYYYYRNDFGDWESFTDTVPTETKF